MRLAGVSIPTNKRVVIALTYVYGIGDTTAESIIKKANVDLSVRVKDLSPDQENAIRVIVEKELKVEGELRRDVQSHIKRLKDIGSYRGTRHRLGLPVRGQRTKSNSRTVRGNVRKTAGSGRRLVTKT